MAVKQLGASPSGGNDIVTQGYGDNTYAPKRAVTGYTSSASSVSVPSGTLGALVTLIGAGAGGGSGGGSTSTQGGGGGAGGEYISFFVPAAVLGPTYSVTIGAAGTGGAAASTTTGNVGANGGDTTFTSGSFTLKARGGLAGTSYNLGGLAYTDGWNGTGVNGASNANGLSPNNTTAPTINEALYGGAGGGSGAGGAAHNGGAGAYQMLINGGGSNAGGVSGGASPGAGSPAVIGIPGAGAGGGATGQAGATATGYGGGGGGGGTSSTSGAGGNGGPGCAIVAFLF